MNLCWTCKHWKGDRAQTAKLIEENPMSMTPGGGWPNSGTCAMSHCFLNVAIHGDAYLDIDFDANFGCIYWEVNN